MTGIIFHSLPELRSNEVMMTIRSGLNYRIYLYMFGYPSHKCKLTGDVDRNNTFMKITKKNRFCRIK